MTPREHDTHDMKENNISRLAHAWSVCEEIYRGKQKTHVCLKIVKQFASRKRNEKYVKALLGEAFVYSVKSKLRDYLVC